MRPAGFWRRYAAYSLDVLAPLALSLPLLWPRGRWLAAQTEQHLSALQLRLWELFDVALGQGRDPLSEVWAWAGDPALRASIEALAGAWTTGLLQAALTVFALAAPWFIAFEASPWQATPGKRLAGLVVTDADGARPGPGRVAARFFAGIPSWLLLHLGHAMAGWRADKRALHDRIAGTRVLLAPGADPRMPAWTRSWLLLQAAGFFGLLGFVVLRYVQLAIEAANAGLP